MFCRDNGRFGECGTSLVYIGSTSGRSSIFNFVLHTFPRLWKWRSWKKADHVTLNSRWRLIIDAGDIYKIWRDLLFTHRCVLHVAILTYHNALGYETWSENHPKIHCLSRIIWIYQEKMIPNPENFFASKPLRVGVPNKVAFRCVAPIIEFHKFSRLWKWCSWQKADHVTLNSR